MRVGGLRETHSRVTRGTTELPNVIARGIATMATAAREPGEYAARIERRPSLRDVNRIRRAFFCILDATILRDGSKSALF